MEDMSMCFGKVKHSDGEYHPNYVPRASRDHETEVAERARVDVSPQIDRGRTHKLYASRVESNQRHQETKQPAARHRGVQIREESIKVNLLRRSVKEFLALREISKQHPQQTDQLAAMHDALRNISPIFHLPLSRKNFGCVAQNQLNSIIPNMRNVFGYAHRTKPLKLFFVVVTKETFDDGECFVFNTLIHELAHIADCHMNDGNGDHGDGFKGIVEGFIKAIVANPQPTPKTYREMPICRKYIIESDSTHLSRYVKQKKRRKIFIFCLTFGLLLLFMYIPYYLCR